MSYLLPKSSDCLRDYSWHQFSADLLAGVTVGLVALPLAMAFAISSGVPPQAGIYTAIIAGFLISVLGGSKAQIGGPNGAFVVIVGGIVANYGIDGLSVCTLVAGAILLFPGVTELGAAVKFIPRPVIVGFTNGIAVLVASTQIKDYFGLTIDKLPGNFVGRMATLASGFHTISWRATILALAATIIILAIHKFARRVPAYIVAMVLGTIVVAASGLSVETIGTRFGGIPNGLPRSTCPTSTSG
jgi:SulP family sulfate permease